MKSQIIQIGIVSVDSGKLMICDPMYLRNWKADSLAQERRYKSIQDEKVYTYRKDFQNFDEKLFNDKTVKELIESGILIRIEETKREGFSYHALQEGISETGFLQCKFPDGHPGLAVAFLSNNGDGEYPVFAEMIDGELQKIWIDFQTR